MQGKKIRKSLELMLFLMAMGLFVTGCTKEKEKASGDEPVTYNTAILYNEQHSSYDKKAEARRQEILKTTDTVKPSTNGVTYYVSYKGDDSNDGKTPETAWRSAEKLAETRGTLIEGDVVLFERGGVYRGAFTISSGVSYGAYGEGTKPCIYESMQNYADEALWEAAE